MDIRRYQISVIHKMALLSSWITLFVLFGSSTLHSQTTDKDIPADQLEWISEEIDEGVYWKKYQGSELFDARLSINIIEIDLDHAQVGLKLAYSQDELTHTSDLAKQFQAIAAINGSFFNMQGGESLVYTKAEGETITLGAPGRNIYIENGGIGWNSDFKPIILSRPDAGWESLDIANLLTSGPLLIYDNNVREFQNDPFHQNRHPRTAVALTHDNKLLFATIDGRSFQSYGMTIPELAQFFSNLGAVYALNLDGGGSTAMWIREKEGTGVVNYPSDNLEFDHDGERPVSNALLIVRQE